MSECRFVVYENCAKCQNCGFSICNVLMPVHRICPAAPKPRLGLGDFIAACLSAIGITKERVSRWLGYDCGCAQRQARWNELGWHFVAIVRRRIGIG